MQFIERANEQGAKKCNGEFVPSTQVARPTDRASKQGKNTCMDQFIPGRGYQADRYRLASPDKQDGYDAECRQYGDSRKMTVC